MKKKSVIITLLVLIAVLAVFYLEIPQKINLINRTPAHGEDKSSIDFNIILISIDTLRADHLGCYRYPRNTSPAIDQFRKDSVLFRKCVSQCPSTLASHASILTSMIPSHHQAFFTRSQPLPQEIRTMAELLKQKNYRCVSFNDGGQIAPEFGLNQGFEIYESMGSKYKHDNLHFKRIVGHTCEWLNENKDERFFLFLHTYETHHPYNPADKYLKLFESEYQGKLPRHISVDLIRSINRGEVPLTDEDKKHILATYDAEIRSMDDSFAQLIAFLKANELYHKTLIIFTSDHGEEFGEHGKWGIHSNTLFNEQLYVPLIIKLPQQKYASRKVNHISRSIDILPTVMELVGLKPLKEFEGHSLVASMKGLEPSEDVFAISQRDMLTTYEPEYWSVMNRKWKLYNSRLYDLLQDPGQLIDVSKIHHKEARWLANYALRFMRSRKITTRTNKKVKPDDKLKKTLETLGYL